MNKYENIEIKSFYDTEDVNDLIDKKIDELGEDNDLVIYAKRDLVAELFINMIDNDYDFGYINFDKLDDLRKDEVYIMTINSQRMINIEYAYRDGIIVEHDSKIAFFYTDDCKQDIIDYCIDNNMKIILFDFEGDEGCCGSDCEYDGCDNCKENLNTYESQSTTISISKSKNGTPNGFTKSWCNDEDGTFSSTTYSFYSDDLGLLKDMAEEFEVRL